ncbi:cytochrome c3 family protein [Phorcysia thermohydrogeniphila]|uniref:Putative CXXCH cytochrome family protein n=1 Tax=Phorcysia thermohydrogeniphila TaxID=936138 RepID=A0A4V2PDB9_9BACT|nr:cytochrome c3 family protein [Phorcysia thermohydrogeniphila]TCK04616.1 putative CXXCH cytochrome family protein [Phorcysia thermohydrogeniphila]
MKRFFSFALLAGVLTAAGCGEISEQDIHYTDLGVNVAVRSAPYLTEENHREAWGQKDCLGCHQEFKHTMATADLSVEDYQKVIDRAVEKVGRKNAINVCSACHGLNGVSEGAERNCLVCHDGMERLHFYAGTSSRTVSKHDFNGNGRIDDFDCVVCHWQPDMDGIVEPDTDFGKLGGTYKYRVEELCLTCHTNGWLVLKSEPLADTDGDGTADRSITPPSQPPVVDVAWGSDYHGGRDYTSGDKSFKDISFDGSFLFHTEHESLACSQCHNPHASNNEELIVEKVGETLLVERPIVQSDNTSEMKYAVVDPQTTAYFEGLKFEGTIVGKDKVYDLSVEEELEDYLNLPIESGSESDDIVTKRKEISSLCAACHEGSSDYSPVNGLGLPVNLETHKPGSECTTCHIHGGTF